MPYQKPWISYHDQLDQLKKRGLTVSDDDKAVEYLERIGYCRLSGYWFPFRERSEICCPLAAEGRSKFKKGNTDKLALDEFKPGATFQQAVELYVFDKKLRLLVMDALERIEIALRVDMAHTLGRHDTFAYLNPDLFRDDFSKELNADTGLTKHHQWLQNHAQLLKRSKEGFLQHNKVKYGLPVAIWIACEVWDFGTLSTLFAGMRPEEQNHIAAKYGLKKGETLQSWLRCLNYLRNVCAHHSRLWNRNIVDQPKKPSAGVAPLFAAAWDTPHTLARPFLLFCITQHLLCTVNPSSSWWERLKAHLLSFPDLSHLELNLAGMGAIEDWESWEWR
ncbi:MAG: Abi family protein [Ketobacter sp.]|nr:Abi family protein [Ketobacter sp.]